MYSKPITFAFASVVALIPLITCGCGGSPFDSMLPLDGAAGIDMLNLLTAGDLADAFDQFRNGASDGAEHSQPSGLSSDQRMAIEELQRRLDAGDITEDEFITGVTEALQDTAPNSPFAGFRFLGSPFNADGVNDFADLLGMTEEQQQQALLIYRLLHADIAHIRAVAQGEIRALLNTQQRAIIDQLATELFERLGVPDEQRAGARLVFDLLVSRLGLTLDQQSQIEAVREEMGGGVQQLHALAQQDFLALLSPEQLGMLESLE